MTATPFTQGQMHVIEWAAKECTKQRSGEASVWWMLGAWNWAMGTAEDAGRPDESSILMLARLVEPQKNAGGYRKVNVRVGLDMKGPWEAVPRQIALLAEAVDDLDPDEWFRHYEEIHPFRDGNGRTGSILWNWLRGTLAVPEDAPDFWDSPPRADLW